MQLNKKSPDWYWYRKNIKSHTIYDLAIKNGMTVGALLWPVTAKAKIQYNMPEIFANRFCENQIMVSFKDDYTTVFMASGMGIKSGNIIEKMNLIDEGPTMAKLLGLTLEDADGEIIYDFIDENNVSKSTYEDKESSYE